MLLYHYYNFGVEHFNALTRKIVSRKFDLVFSIILNVLYLFALSCITAYFSSLITYSLASSARLDHLVSVSVVAAFF